MPRPTNTELRRGQIVDALGRLMAEHGYHRSSVAAIAQAAGLSPGLLHYHFDSKQQILLALVETLGQTIRERFARRLGAAGESPWARLEAFVDAFLSPDADARPEVVPCWVAIAAEAARQPEVAAVYRSVLGEVLDHLTALCAAVLGAEGGDPGDARALAASLLAAIEGHFLIATAASGLVPEGTAADTVVRMARGYAARQVPR